MSYIQDIAVQMPHEKGCKHGVVILKYLNMRH